MQSLVVNEKQLKDLEADFLRLLETDRESPEFVELYRRFDAALDEVLQPENVGALV